MDKRKPTPAGAGTTTAASAAATPSGTPSAGQQQPPVESGATTSQEGASASAQVDAGELVDARVLLAFDEHEPDDVVEVSADAVDQLEHDGKIDTHPDAVAFARSLKA